jgi:hypothetical protein
MRPPYVEALASAGKAISATGTARQGSSAPPAKSRRAARLARGTRDVKAARRSPFATADGPPEPG